MTIPKINIGIQTKSGKYIDIEIPIAVETLYCGGTEVKVNVGVEVDEVIDILKALGEDRIAEVSGLNCK